MLFCPRPAAALLLLVLLPFAALAGEDALPLKIDRSFRMLPALTEQPVAFISAQRIEARQDQALEATGAVELRQGSQIIHADHLRYGQESRDVLAEGNVSLEHEGGQIQGPRLQMNLDSNLGEMSSPAFRFRENRSRGLASVLHISGKQQYSFADASYTTCPAGNDDWLLKMSRLNIDRAAQVGVAYHARIEFLGVPLLYTPWMDFGLNTRKRSGFLGPVIGSTNSGGAEITVPYFWNIAPNLDMTFAPRAIAKRGTQFNNELRYLDTALGGEMHLDVLSGDRVRNINRSRAAWKHGQNLGHGFYAAWNLNSVSDDAYFRDLSDTVNSTSQTNLLRDGSIAYGGGWWTASARVQRFQTLQDPLAPVAIPYRRQPQFNLNAQQPLAAGNVTLQAEYVDFRHPSALNGQRMVFYPSASYPLSNEPGYFLTPKLGLHHTSYTFSGNTPAAARTLPIFSLDGGLLFERNDSLLGNAYMQTLEPRAYYVKVPYRAQDQLPVFDTAQAPFSFSQMFTENRFLGSDRIGDADMLTLALTSRMIDEEDGTERLRVAAAERFSFRTPQVNLVIPAAANYRSDIILSLGGQLTHAWKLDSLAQYNPNMGYTETYSMAARYSPEAGKLLNLGYRYTRNTLRQMDISTQWPLVRRWQGLGRLNYSLLDNRILEALVGLEYNQDCWALRLVGQSFTTATRVRTTGLFLQLELNDMVRLGSDPLATLRSSVFGYTKLNDAPVEKPSAGLR